MSVEYLVIVLLIFGLVSLSVLLLRVIAKNRKYEKRYSRVIDIDSEVDKSKAEQKSIESTVLELRQGYTEKKAIFDKLVAEIAIYNEDIELAELGFYKPHYSYDTSEMYKEESVRVRNLQKTMVKEKAAINSSIEWTVEGSKAKGRVMTNRGVRLAARAFNNECDSAIANVAWNNAERLELRIQKAFDAINKLNETTKIKISTKYLKLKIEELRLAHEYKQKKQEEKEEQSAIRQQMREEAKLEKEIEKAQKEEEKYRSLLDKALADSEKASGSKLTSLQERISLLEVELSEAHAKNERAKSMAEQTRVGHVYIISNVGSFGEGIYKIGMTRRLDPLDRVKELGDASVPFTFDIHAIVYSEDAPSLEKSLHRTFDSRRVNLVNGRKEFFEVSLEEIESEIRAISPDSEFYRTVESKEYRETNSIRAQREKRKLENSLESQFPDAI